MHEFLNIFKAIFFGFSTGLVISLPLGPAGIESVKRTISKGYREGFTVSLGAIAADMAYLLIINCGFSNILSKNTKQESYFWVISGLILCFIGYKSINDTKEDSIKNTYSMASKLKSMPFLAGFLITFVNPITPSLWFTLSGTVIRAWSYVNLLCYYIFIFSILAGMICWFIMLNSFALKGKNMLAPSRSKKMSYFLKLSILVIGIFFTGFGILRLLV